MTQNEIDNCLDFWKSETHRLGTLPNHIFTKSTIFIDSLSKKLNYSNRDSKLFTNLLLENGFLDIKNNIFLILTPKGYSVINGEESDNLLLYLNKLIDYNPNTVERTFYNLWDIIGANKEENPYYVDGKTFYDISRQFIDGLPPRYSLYTRQLQEKGESTSRIEWGLKLFKQIPEKEISVFFDLLSESINQKYSDKTKINDREENIDAEIDQLLLGAETLNSERLDNSKMDMKKSPKIFISHNSKDRDYAKSLVQLLINLGIDEENDVFCSSLPGCGVKFGKSFIEAIREQYEKYDLIMLFIHSPRYYESHVSLCEMGAAWIMKNEHRSFLTHDCTFKILDAVVPPDETAFRAGQESTYPLLNDFKEFLEQKFKLKPKNSSRWDDIKTDFIKSVTNTVD